MSNVLEIDEVDRNIIELIQKKPNLTHTEIAKQVNRSQPTVGMRIRKLEEMGVLKFQAGINMRAADLQFAKVFIRTKIPDKLIKLISACPFMLNGFRLSGKFNLTILLAGLTLKDIDEIVNVQFRNNPLVYEAKVQMITEVINDFVLPINLNYSCDEEHTQSTSCRNCKKCELLISEEKTF